MFLVRSLFLLLSLTSIVGQCFSQAANGDFEADFDSSGFAGTWKFDRDRSAKNASLARFEEWTLQIGRAGSKLNMLRSIKVNGKTRADNLTYYPDARGEENPTGFDKEKRKTTTAWKDDKIEMKFTLSTRTSWGDLLQQEILEIWEMSPDRNTLTIITDAGEERGNRLSGRNVVFQPARYNKVFNRIN